MSWVTIKWSDIRGVRRSGSHRMTKRILHWPYCSNCKLMALRNDVTRRALRAPCVWWEDEKG